MKILTKRFFFRHKINTKWFRYRNLWSNILSIIEIYDLGTEFHGILQVKKKTLILLKGNDSFGGFAGSSL